MTETTTSPRAVLRTAGELRPGDEVMTFVGGSPPEDVRAAAGRVVTDEPEDIVETVRTADRTVSLRFHGRRGEVSVLACTLVVVIERGPAPAGVGGV